MNVIGWRTHACLTVQNRNRGTVQENLKVGISAVRKASENGADLILFPEVQLTEFFPQHPGQDVSGYACELDGESVQTALLPCLVVVKSHERYAAAVA